MSQRIIFKEDAINLDLPDSPPTVVDGWKIVPVTPTQVEIFKNKFGTC